MAIAINYYGSIADADSYFANRLHSGAWLQADPADQPKALWAASVIIDTLNYKGIKHALWALDKEFAYPPNFYAPRKFPTPEAIHAANLSQPLEFPRDSDTVVPSDIEQACYEIAFSLLDGRDPELELESLGITQMAYGQVQSSYNRYQPPIEHLVNGIPNALAWRLIRPYLASSDEIRLTRVS